MSTTTLHLAKQNFKFSAAHFLIFNKTSAEKLHGHNYQVRVDIQASQKSQDHQDGYFVDFNIFKKIIKQTVDAWDEHVLLPQLQEEMSFTEKGGSLEVRFRDRFYVFPKEEVILLPLTNTSVEQLSSLLAKKFLQEFKVYGVEFVTVYVEETQGQSASTSMP